MFSLFCCWLPLYTWIRAFSRVVKCCWHKKKKKNTCRSCIYLIFITFSFSDFTWRLPSALAPPLDTEAPDSPVEPLQSGRLAAPISVLNDGRQLWTQLVDTLATLIWCKCYANVAAVGEPEGVGRFDVVRVLKTKKKEGTAPAVVMMLLLYQMNEEHTILWEFELCRDAETAPGIRSYILQMWLKLL